MSRKVTYQLTLEIDVEVEDENDIPHEMNFGTFVEDGTLSIYANHGEDTLVGCVQLQNRCIFIDAPKETTGILLSWDTGYEGIPTTKHSSRLIQIQDGDTVENTLVIAKQNFCEYLQEDAHCAKAPQGHLDVFGIYAQTVYKNGELEFLDYEEYEQFLYDGKEVIPII